MPTRPQCRRRERNRSHRSFSSISLEPQRHAVRSQGRGGGRNVGPERLASARPSGSAGRAGASGAALHPLGCGAARGARLPPKARARPHAAALRRRQSGEPGDGPARGRPARGAAGPPASSSGPPAHWVRRPHTRSPARHESARRSTPSARPQSQPRSGPAARTVHGAARDSTWSCEPPPGPRWAGARAPEPDVSGPRPARAPETPLSRRPAGASRLTSVAPALGSRPRKGTANSLWWRSEAG